MRLFLLAVALLSTPLVSADDDIALTISDATCDSPWSVSSFESSCDGNGCSFGDTVEASATVDVSSDFDPSDVTASIGVSFLDITVYSTTVDDLCEHCEANDGQECGAAGSYTCTAGVPIPDESTVTSILMSITGNYVKVTVTFGGITSCYVHVNKVSSGSSMSMVGYSVVFGSMLVGAAIYGVRRRRRVIQDESLKRTLTDFEMVPDVSARAVAV